MQVQPETEALRCYCRVAVLMQRACDAVHARNARHMPLDAQLRLLSVLQVRSSQSDLMCAMHCCFSSQIDNTNTRANRGLKHCIEKLSPESKEMLGILSSLCAVSQAASPKLLDLSSCS